MLLQTIQTTISRGRAQLAAHVRHNSAFLRAGIVLQAENDEVLVKQVTRTSSRYHGQFTLPSTQVRPGEPAEKLLKMEVSRGLIGGFYTIRMTDETHRHTSEQDAAPVC